MDYFTVDGETRTTYEINRSIFIATVRGVTSYNDGIEFVKRISSEFSDATHNCYALVALGGEQKFSDNGEPQGSAGQPILQVLKKRNLTNVACVVTRYFGGIKLGAGGLVAAYTKATCDALDNAKIVEKKESYVCEIKVSYADLGFLNNLLATYPVFDRKYENDVTVTFALPIGSLNSFTEKVNETFNGKLKIETKEKKHIDFNL